MANKKNKEQTINDKLPLAKSSGKLIFGYKCTIKSLYNKSSKLAITTKNLPAHQRKMIENIAKINNIPIFDFDGNNNDLAIAADIAHSVGSLSIIDEGTSNLIEFIHKKIPVKN